MYTAPDYYPTFEKTLLAAITMQSCGRPAQSMWIALLSAHGKKRLHRKTRLPPMQFCVFSSGSSVQQTCTDLDSNSTVKQLHKPVMLREVVSFLDLKPGQVFLDMTFGAGGHTKAILNATPGVTVYALDRDPLAFQMAQQLSAEQLSSSSSRVHPILGRFSDVVDLLSRQGVHPGSLDAVLLDAGCSSMQLDNPKRGFSISKDGPLDMRMDENRFPTMPDAADVVNALDQQALVSILSTYGEERYAKKIASAIVAARSIQPITRTQQLASIIAGAFSPSVLYARKDLLQRPAHVATKTFQALRIFVNDELHELHSGLQAAEMLLGCGGRLCVLTFHSLEDRLVKRFLHGLDVTAPPRRSVRQWVLQGRTIGDQEEKEDEEDEGVVTARNACWVCEPKKAIMPQEAELQENPRGRSAKLRAAVRL
ncbi:12S rRNA N(4)-cytidine methyltransferase METTL15 isoform X2 [Scleropages formosus]|uniref:12S rRNA N(4)-cytidine methyltransferase METTL15 isoform X2 n=1 Tax=Scleropages formosus TaxID=113540 RepID=UPI0010FACCE5|nr:probable methyltransferase-like protein 15 isoform X2 [Scleropages formosus]